MKTTTLPFSALSNEADIDYLLARWLHFAGGMFAIRAGFSAQQACEKYMKAVLIQYESQYPNTHKLLKLADMCLQYSEFFGELETRINLQSFDVFDQIGRYGPAANFDPHARKSHEFQIAGVGIWSNDYLYALDRFVFHVRGLLDFNTVAQSDSIISILNRDRRSGLVAMWNARPPLHVVLTKENQFYTRKRK
jgi:HEPN domain-containing protein